MKATFKQIRKFNIIGGEFLAKNVNTKLAYAIKRVKEISVDTIVKSYQNALNERYFDDVQRQHVENALTDKTTGAILNSPQGSQRPYLYDKEGLMKVLAAENTFENETAVELLKEWDEKEFDILPYTITDIPETLTDEQKEAFEGFVI